MRHCSPWNTAEVWLIKDELRGSMTVWFAPLSWWQNEKKWQDERERTKAEWEMAGSTLITPGPHCEWAVDPEGKRKRKEWSVDAEKDQKYIHVHHSLVPVVFLCNYGSLSLACSHVSVSLLLLPLTPSVFNIPLFALFLLICANHHETTATLEPLTGIAWHPAPSKHIIA